MGATVGNGRVSLEPQKAKDAARGKGTAPLSARQAENERPSTTVTRDSDRLAQTSEEPRLERVDRRPRFGMEDQGTEAVGKVMSSA